MTRRASKRKTTRNPERKICFVIAPMGHLDSETRERSELVFEDVIKPAARKCHYSAEHTKDANQPGFITTSIIRHLASADVVIADVTGGNPNVFYELALRHATGKPVIQLVATNEELAFDIRGLRTIQFDLSKLKARQRAIRDIAKQIRLMEQSESPSETPVSLAGADVWTPFRPGGASAQEEKQIDDLIEHLAFLLSSKTTPAVMKPLIQDLKKHIEEDIRKNPRIKLLEDPADDLEAALLLVRNVPRGGHISATSSLQHKDADEHDIYREAINDALLRKVTYSKVICSSITVTPDRREKWLDEFADKAALIREGKIRPNSFELLHYPFPMSVDVLISRDARGECKEMVAGFAGGLGRGGFYTKDERMVRKWRDIYVEEKIIAEAEHHTKAVLDSKERCDCWHFMKLLENARKSAVSPQTRPRKMTTKKTR
jgi:hypothetical protein